jgi:hypothetical protein
MKKNSTPGELQERKPTAQPGTPGQENGKETPSRRSFITRELRSALPYLKNSDVKVWLCFSSHANREGLAWPSDLTVARETGLAFRTVRSGKMRLIKAGLLVPTDQKRQRGRFGKKVFRVVEPFASRFEPTDAQKGDSGEASTDAHFSTITDDHFASATDIQFSPPHQERSPNCKVVPSKASPISSSGSHRQNNGHKKPDEQVHEFFAWWRDLYTQRYGYEPNIPSNAGSLLKKQLLRGEPIQQIQLIAAAYLDDPNPFYVGHSLSSLLEAFYDRFKVRCRVQPESQAPGGGKQEQDPYRDLEVNVR